MDAEVCYIIVMTANVLNIILVSFILVGMVMIIAGIRHIFDEESARDAEDSLRRQIKEEDKVISSHSVFRDFLSPMGEPTRESGSKRGGG